MRLSYNCFGRFPFLFLLVLINLLHDYECLSCLHRAFVRCEVWWSAGDNMGNFTNKMFTR